MKAGAKRMLEVLAGTGMVLTRSQVAVQAKVKKSGGTFGTYWSTLKSNGLIDEDDTGAWATPAGVAFAGVAVTTPTTSEEMVALWMDRLKDGARRILRLLVDRYPDWADVADVAAEAGISTSGGTWGTYLSMLATNGLIEVSGSRTTGRLRASPDIMISG